MKTRFASPILALLTLLASSEARADYLFQHTGANDPTTEGWTRFGPFTGGITFGPVFDDLGQGIRAWSVDDNSPIDGSYAQYRQSLTVAQSLLASTGWEFSLGLRVVDVPDNVDGSVYGEVYIGGHYFLMVFGSKPSGDPVVRLASGISGNTIFGTDYSLDGYGAGYHDYRLAFDPMKSGVSLSVDGNLIAQDFQGFADTHAPSVGWGGGQSATLGEGRFNSVTFSAGASQVPEPSSFALASVGLICLVAATHRRRRAA
jgi:hypothetical protein